MVIRRKTHYTNHLIITPISILNLNQYFDKFIDIIVYIKNIKEIDTKKGEKMCFITSEDETSILDVVLFPNTYKNVSFQVGDIILLNGHVEKRFDKLQVIANSVKIIND